MKIICTLTSWHCQFDKGFGHSIFADRPEVFAVIFLNTLRAREHQGNWQLQHNRNFWEPSPISSRQLVSRLAGTDWGNLCLISCSHHLKWVCLSADFVHFFSVTLGNNIDSVTICGGWDGTRGEDRRKKNIGCIHSSVMIWTQVLTRILFRKNSITIQNYSNYFKEWALTFFLY
jgi:hypothetical protein